MITGLTLAGVAYQFLPHYDPVRLAAWNQVQPRIQQTDEATKNEASQSSQQIREFFAERKKNARHFAEDMLCLSSKWAYVKGMWSSGSHESYLQECFRRNLFSPDELKGLIESAVSRYVSEIQGRENQLLVDIRADLEGSELAAPQYLPSLISDAEFKQQYDAMLQQVVPLLAKEMGVSVTREIISWAGSEIAAELLMEIGVSLATELGVSSGIIAAGASSSVVTFGVGLAAAFLVDMALDTIMRQAGYDPEGEIAAKVCETLDHIERIILEGEKKKVEQYESAKWNSTWSLSSSVRESAWAEAQALEASGGLGLNHQLQHINDVRTRLRNEALKGLILTGGAK